MTKPKSITHLIMSGPKEEKVAVFLYAMFLKSCSLLASIAGVMVGCWSFILAMIAAEEEESSRSCRPLRRLEEKILFRDAAALDLNG